MRTGHNPDCVHKEQNNTDFAGGVKIIKLSYYSMVGLRVKCMSYPSPIWLCSFHTDSTRFALEKLFDCWDKPRIWKGSL